MFDIGFQELVIIFLVALLVFGPDKLPEIARTLARWMIEIRKGFHSAKAQMESEFEEARKKETLASNNAGRPEQEKGKEEEKKEKIGKEEGKEEGENS